MGIFTFADIIIDCDYENPTTTSPYNNKNINDIDDINEYHLPRDVLLDDGTSTLNNCKTCNDDDDDDIGDDIIDIDDLDDLDTFF